MKKVEIRATKSNGVVMTITLCFIRDMTKKEIISRESEIIKKIKEDYKDVESAEMLIPMPSPKDLPKSRLLEIGEEIASGWGGSCISLQTFKEGAYFHCIEHGEKFGVYLGYDDIRKGNY